jgi:hypothetical protein
VAEGAQRDVDEARPQLDELLRREPALPEGARPVPLREDVGLADEVAQRLELLGLPQVELRRELAVAGIVLLVADVRRCAAVFFMTSAPYSARVRAQVSPASTRVRSSTRTPESGRLPSGSGSGGLSPILRISISGSEAIAADWGCFAHSSIVRTIPPAPLAAMIASSSSSASHLATACLTASRSSGTPSTLSAAARWFGKLQCR